MSASRSVFIHPRALCESSAVGPGTRVWAFAQIMDGAVVGEDCNVGGHSFVEAGARVGDRVTVKNGVLIWEGVTIEDDVFVGPGVIFTNDRVPRSPRMAGVPKIARRYGGKDWVAPTTIGHGASLGAGAIIGAGLRIGAYAMVGAGANVTHDVPDHALVVGNPARLSGWVCVCGARLAVGELPPARCPDCRA